MHGISYVDLYVCAYYLDKLIESHKLLKWSCGTPMYTYPNR